MDVTDKIPPPPPQKKKICVRAGWERCPKYV